MYSQALAEQSQIDQQLAAVLTKDGLCPGDILTALETVDLLQLMEAATAVRDRHHSHITFSPKVFLPLTFLCNDKCGYCTFARGPIAGRRAYMTLDEVLEVARLGALQGCTEALFTLGDKPELKYPEAAAELEAMGFSSTLDYVAHAALEVLRQTGLLPHINAGVMDQADIIKLKAVSASQGLMLESLSPDLMLPGAAHYDCPDKEPAKRLAVLEAAGVAKVPFTTGILIGIGETRKDRIEALLAIRESHEKHGHVQEVIIQNFRAKKGTAMSMFPEPPLTDLQWTIAAARLILPPDISLQAPPNLTPESDDASVLGDVSGGWLALLAAGINDWGGVSPLTRDFVNPEKPWPHLQQLAEVTAKAGFPLVPRLPVYPHYLQSYALLSSSSSLSPQWFESAPGRSTLQLSDAHGLARCSTWYAGAVEEVFPMHADTSNATTSSSSSSTKASSMPALRPRPNQLWQVTSGVDGIMQGAQRPQASSWVQDLLSAVTSGHQLSEDEITSLFEARGHDFDAVCKAADDLRSTLHGNVVTYVVNRNINYTNVCTYGCKFCAFSKGPASDSLRGSPYLLSLDEIQARALEAWNKGATEVCMQGGIHPDFTGETYLAILKAVKKACPDMHVHAFSPLEVSQGAATLGWSLERYLKELKNAGLGSLPGTAAEVLDDSVRAMLCSDKLSTQEWLEVIETAHLVGLKTTSTIMFGSVEGPRAWARHLLQLRSLQQRTGGITEFVPLPFVHMQAPIYKTGKARAGPTLKECVLMHAVGRLTLTNIPSIQASWVKMGPDQAAALLGAGCNDMGGVLMNESITRAAGASHGQQVVPMEMERLITEAGRVPRQRTTLYGVPAESQIRKSLENWVAT